jgi:hypothetical protein
MEDGGGEVLYFEIEEAFFGGINNCLSSLKLKKQ